MYRGLFSALVLEVVCSFVFCADGEVPDINILDARFSIVNRSHLETTQFGGEVGVLDGDDTTSDGVVVGTPGAPAQLIYVPAADGGTVRLQWKFNAGVIPEKAFAGVFFNLSRENRQDPVTGKSIKNTDLKPLNFLKLPTIAGEQTIQGVLVSFSVAQETDVKVELVDVDETTNLPVGHSVAVQHFAAGTYSAIFQLSKFNSFPIKANLQRVQQVNLIIDRQNVALKSKNADAGTLDLQRIALVTKPGKVVSADVSADELGRAEFERLARGAFNWMQRHRDTQSGLVFDRTAFIDLLAIAPTGYWLMALPEAVQRGWVTRGEALAAGMKVLDWANRDNKFGLQPTGKIGYKGLHYRFIGLDAERTRKIDKDQNAVDLGVIDSAIFLTGVDVFGAFFSSELEVKSRVDAIFARVEWPFFFDQASQQFRLSFKPAMDGAHTIPSPGGGFFSGNTIDYYTDEGTIVCILAANDAALGATPFYKMIRQKKNGVVVSFPGAWFTYCFATTSVLVPWLGTDRGAQFGGFDVDWHANAVLAAGVADASGSRLSLPNAGERPNGSYLAEGSAALAVNSGAPDTGTRYPYSALMASALGGALGQRAVTELYRESNKTGMLHGSFGLMDAFHDDLADFVTRPTSGFSTDRPALRTTGAWTAQTHFGINEGPGLVAALNRIGGYSIARLALRSPRVGNGISLIWRGLPASAVQIEVPVAGELKVEKAVLKVDTAKSTLDSLKFTAAFLAAGYKPSPGDQLSIEFGNVARSFLLDGKLQSKSKTGEFSAGVHVQNDSVAMSFQFKSGLTALATLDFSKPVTVRLYVNSRKAATGEVVFPETPEVLSGEVSTTVVAKGTALMGKQ